MSRVFPALLIVALCGSASTRADEARAGAIAPFLNDEVVAILHLDLTKVNLNDLLTRLFQDRDAASEYSKELGPWFAALRKAGAEELYLVASPADFPGLPSAVVPLGNGADATAIGKLLCGGGPEKSPVVWPTCATIQGAVFAGTSVALERVRRSKAVARPELGTALAVAGDTAVQLLLLPTGDHRRVVEEMLPTFPQELGGGPITTLTHGLLWAALGLQVEPRPTVRFVIQSQDAASAQALKEVGQDALRWLEQAPWLRRRLPDFAKISAQLQPTVVEDRISLNVDLEQGSALVGTLNQYWRETVGRRECVNNMKQIGLAMHNYHDIHKSFPPAFSRDKSGRPLLSWRVHILPYVEQASLYKEFHLDEPWDSPHNRLLIDKIPQVYRCPSMGRKPAVRGKTTYLTPRGKATIFPGAEGIKLNEITDGTSNTILVVDASDELAVTWTEPKDWDVDPEFVVKGLFGHHPGGTSFGLADGSVKFVKETINLDVLKALLTRNGGEVISADAF